jgi:hypothetical protein
VRGNQIFGIATTGLPEENNREKHTEIICVEYLDACLAEVKRARNRTTAAV